MKNYSYMPFAKYWKCPACGRFTVYNTPNVPSVFLCQECNKAFTDRDLTECTSELKDIKPFSLSCMSDVYHPGIILNGEPYFQVCSMNTNLENWHYYAYMIINAIESLAGIAETNEIGPLLSKLQTADVILLKRSVKFKDSWYIYLVQSLIMLFQKYIRKSRYYEYVHAIFVNGFNNGICWRFESVLPTTTFNQLTESEFEYMLQNGAMVLGPNLFDRIEIRKMNYLDSINACLPYCGKWYDVPELIRYVFRWMNKCDLGSLFKVCSSVVRAVTFRLIGRYLVREQPTPSDIADSIDYRDKTAEFLDVN